MIITRNSNLKKTLKNTTKQIISPAYRTYQTEHYARNLFEKTPNLFHRTMLAYLHNKQPSRALQVFTNHVRFGSFDEISTALALKACCAYPFVSFSIHSLAVTTGFVSHITVSNSLMSTYCKAGFFRQALHVFEALSDPDIFSWNTLLSGFENCDDALRFACRMRSCGVAFDPVTFTTLLSLCSREEEFAVGLQLHCWIMKFGFVFDIFVANALITMYARWGHLSESRRVFEEMRKRDMVSWNALITGYTQYGNLGLDAIYTFIEMVRDGVELDHGSFTSAIAACAQETKLELGKQIHALSIKRAYGKHVSVGNVLMSIYSKCEVHGDARLVFQNMTERNVVSWTTMISIDEQNALSIFRSMRLDGVYPNDVTFIGVIHAIVVGDLVEAGKMIHGFCIKTSFDSEVNVCNSLITMYAKFKSMQDSMKVFEEQNYRETITWNALISGNAQNGLCQEAIQMFLAASMHCKPNEYTFGSVLSAIGSAEDVSLKYGQRCHSQIMKLGLNFDPIVSSALLDMYAKRGNISESHKVFTEVPERTQFSWTAIISAYARHGDHESVMSWFKKMEKEGVVPDSITFLSVLTACARNGMLDIGCKLFNSMVNNYKIEPSQEHYSCMVDILGRAGRLEEAEEMLQRVPGGPGLSMLQSLLGSCRIYGNVDMGERVADALMDMEPTDSGSYVLLSNLYAEKKQWEKVAKLRNGMRKKGVKKEIGFSWVDVGDAYTSLSLHAFSAGDKSHSQSDEIHRMAEFIGLEMRDKVREYKKDRQRQHCQVSFL